MKKSILLLTMMLLITVIAFAQNETNSYKNELAVDLSGILGTIIGNPNNQLRSVQYRRYGEERVLRLSLRINHRFEERNGEQENQFFTVATNIGWENLININDNWQAFYGLDVLFSYFNSKSTISSPNQIIHQKNQGNTIGLAPLAGIRFQLNDRLSLFTETSFQVIASRSESERAINNGTPEYNTSIGLTTNYQHPVSLSIAYRF